MLSEVLSKDTCAACRFCCSFRRCSLWETPVFSPEAYDKLSKENEYGVIPEFVPLNHGAGSHVNEFDGSCQIQLLHKYQTEDSQEEAPCDFLDPDRGCILSDEDKPFDCKIWPLRIMQKGEHLVIALTPTCPAIGREPSEKMRELVLGGLGRTIYEYALAHPSVIKEYREGFPVIMETGLLNQSR